VKRYFLLGFLVGCDDTVFPAVDHGSAVVGDSYADVTSIFEASCNSCHSAGGQAGGLDLETDACATLVGVQASSYAGLRVAAGDSASSVLWAKVADSGEYGGVMPPSGMIAGDSIDTIAAWIDAGASCDIGAN
jgi:cytochrome c5